MPWLNVIAFVVRAELPIGVLDIRRVIGQSARVLRGLIAMMLAAASITVLGACDAAVQARSTNNCDRPMRVGLFRPDGNVDQLTDDKTTLIPVGGSIAVEKILGGAENYGHLRLIVGTDSPMGTGVVSQKRLEEGPIAVRIEGRCGPGALCTFKDDVFDCG